ncbi:MAG TPA: shikimate dehydrogenase, partial [Polyangia bacterium]|nr:shikimate dehydrogenase [Polyangia bacterium]
MIRAAVLGADVSKSRSPAIHEAAFRALGVEGSYVALSVDARGFRRLVASLRQQG